jgi:hypothetical protein
MLPLAVNSPDDFQTPGWALDYLLPYLRRHPTLFDEIIWESAFGAGNLCRALLAQGFSVVGSDIRSCPESGLGWLNESPTASWRHTWEKDFRTWTPPHPIGAIITNPPYGKKLKEQFLERCFELGKPFALLLPFTALEGKQRQALYRQHGIEVIVPDRRIDFETPNQAEKSSSWFPTAWFTWGLNVGSALSFPTWEECRR